MRARLLGALRRADAGLAACEAGVLAVFVGGLIAGGLALVVRQNLDGDADGIVSVLLLVGVALLAAAGWKRSGRALLAGVFLMLVAGALHLGADVDYLVRVAVLWIGLLGASLAARGRRHITIEVLTRALPRAARRPADIVVHLTALVLLSILAAVALEYVLDARERGEVFRVFERSGFELPGWWVKSILPFGFVTMAWRSFLELFRDGDGA